MVIKANEISVPEDNVEIKVHDVEKLRQIFDSWDSFRKEKKIELIRSVKPEEEYSTHNITCVGLDETIVDLLDESNQMTESASDIAVGDDDSTAPSHSNTSLNNKVGELEISTFEDQGSSLLMSAFADSSQLNNYVIKEAGIITEEDTLLNHADITNVDKTSSKTMTIEITLSFTNQ